MADDRSVHLREVDEEWIAVEEDSDPVGRGPTAQQALGDLESKLGGDGFGESVSGSPEQSNPLAEVYAGDRLPTISSKVELLFAVAAVGVGAMYLLFGNIGGAVLVAIGLALLFRVAWIEYDLFGPKQ